MTLPTADTVKPTDIYPSVLSNPQGQSSVDAVTAQIAFSAVPLWSALLTALLLPGDSALGPLTWVGGGCMVIAGVVGVLPPKPTPAEAKK